MSMRGEDPNAAGKVATDAVNHRPTMRERTLTNRKEFLAHREKPTSFRRIPRRASRSRPDASGKTADSVAFVSVEGSGQAGSAMRHLPR